MTVTLQSPGATRPRDPRELLNAVQPRIQHLSVNVLDSGMTIWDREVALLLRDEVMVRDLAERILGNAVMYVVASMEHPDVHLGVGKVVDIGVHQVILDTAEFLRSIGFDPDEELWARDGAECSPCDSKVPDSH
ncbi:hypothetical protein P3T35_001500 [Kitasatospora sp. GP30]|uniref:hypothetical protein n=1 Tax=Kitasatospora sp. GP30 TaxID=3035084 RepID=UPI000C70B67A|nr:hypothetical protein [Kitasatospora sp. GP30]MDH6139500.1 hypothetical protein [Kitasatospora sp. GP30]